MISNDQKKYPKNPRQNANVISLITFWWTRKIFQTGYNKDLEETDIYATLTQDRTSNLGEIISKGWEKEVESCAKKKNGKPQLLRVLLRIFAKPLLLIGVAEGVMELFPRLYKPLLLATLLRYFASDKKEWSDEVYYSAAGLILLSFTETFFSHYSVHCSFHLGLKMKVACTALIYQKILKLSNSVLDNETSVGQVVNFLSSDIAKFEDSVLHLHYIWIAPLQIIWITYATFSEIGWAALIGIFIFLLIMPFQGCLAKIIIPLMLKLAQKTDDRLRLMNQVITGLQVIKMYVWEIPFYNLVEKARKREMIVTKKYFILKELTFTLKNYIPRLSLFATIVTYVLFGNYINAEKVYLITAYYNVLRFTTVHRFSSGVNQVLQALVCIRRLRRFMLHDEIIKMKQNPCQTVPDSFALRMTNVNAKWHGDSKDDTLRNVNLTVPPGNFVAIVGQVGSGKSSLLQAILQELPLTNGSIVSNGRIIYVSQQPWIFASSVKQNILFGQPMDKLRYDEVIRVCQMESDIDSFPHGDRTIVGERGMNLSGGQRARINLARAIYKEADIYLLDDPLSAVDSHVSKRLMDKCICGYLKGKTRILVTHQLQYLQLADQIIVMNNGSIEQKGTFDELQALGHDFMKLVKATDAKSKEAESRQSIIQRQISMKAETRDDNDNSSVEMQETIAKGRVSGGMLLAYFKATRSPIFDHLGASLQGLTTIRAFNAEEILISELYNHQDVHTSASFLFLSTSRAFGFYIDVICQLYIGTIIIIFTVFNNLAVVGDIGLIITQVMSLTNMLQWGIRQTAEVESQLTSIERILEYSHLEEEPMIDSKPETKPPDDWPTKGLVEFKNVSLKYNRRGAYILRNVNFTILPKEKIGIVGRTGAGKSSLINALFRLAYVEGKILIDDVSTDAIALHDFRSKISIIPQEPFLFNGSLRRNLDPFDQYSDTVLWQALQDVELKETISEMVAGLNTKVSDEGSNFSVGQKQLLCLARAIIKNNRIMILDEATANIDPYTDSFIQKTVRTKFINCTVFTIAHRLNTIMDNDRIFVMNAGQLVEFDHPYILLQQKGYFYNMVLQTGTAMAENLIDIATKNFYNKDKST